MEAPPPALVEANAFDVVVTLHPSCGASHELRLEPSSGVDDGGGGGGGGGGARQAPPPLLVGDLMEAIAARSGFPVWRQRLFLGGELLSAEQSLGELASQTGVPLEVELVPRRGRQRQADPVRLQQWAANARARVAAEGRGGG